MEETKFTTTVHCKVPLTEADLRWLEQDITRRLQTALVQKLASVTFSKEHHGNEPKNPPGP